MKEQMDLFYSIQILLIHRDFPSSISRFVLRIVVEWLLRKYILSFEVFNCGWHYGTMWGLMSKRLIAKTVACAPRAGLRGCQCREL